MFKQYWNGPYFTDSGLYRTEWRQVQIGHVLRCRKKNPPASPGLRNLQQYKIPRKGLRRHISCDGSKRTQGLMWNPNDTSVNVSKERWDTLPSPKASYLLGTPDPLAALVLQVNHAWSSIECTRNSDRRRRGNAATGKNVDSVRIGCWLMRRSGEAAQHDVYLLCSVSRTLVLDN